MSTLLIFWLRRWRKKYRSWVYFMVYCWNDLTVECFDVARQSSKRICCSRTWSWEQHNSIVVNIPLFWNSKWALLDVGWLVLQTSLLYQVIMVGSLTIIMVKVENHHIPRQFSLNHLCSESNTSTYSYLQKYYPTARLLLYIFAPLMTLRCFY